MAAKSDMQNVFKDTKTHRWKNPMTLNIIIYLAHKDICSQHNFQNNMHTGYTAYNVNTQ